MKSKTSELAPILHTYIKKYILHFYQMCCKLIHFRHISVLRPLVAAFSNYSPIETPHFGGGEPRDEK